MILLVVERIWTAWNSSFAILKRRRGVPGSAVGRDWSRTEVLSEEVGLRLGLVVGYCHWSWRKYPYCHCAAAAVQAGEGDQQQHYEREHGGVARPPPLPGIWWWWWWWHRRRGRMSATHIKFSVFLPPLRRVSWEASSVSLSIYLRLSLSLSLYISQTLPLSLSLFYACSVGVSFYQHLNYSSRNWRLCVLHSVWGGGSIGIRQISRQIIILLHYVFFFNIFKYPILPSPQLLYKSLNSR